MNCRKFEEYLQDYLDGDVTQQISDQMEEHALKCSKCRDALDQFSDLQELIKIGDEPDAMPSKIFFDTVLKTALLEAKQGQSHEKVKSFLHSLESFFQNLIIGKKPAYQLMRSCAVLIFGIVIGISVFKNPQQMLVADNKPTPTTEIRSVNSAEPVNNSSGSTVSEPKTPNISSIPELSQNSGSASTEIVKSPRNSSSENTEEIAINDRLTIKPVNNEADSMNQLASLLETINKLSDNNPQQIPSAIPVSAAGEDQNKKLAALAQQIKKSDVLNTLQTMKMNLYMSGDTKYIPEMHQVEKALYDIVSSDKTGNNNDIDAFMTYQKAENSLLNKQYFEAVKFYYATAKKKPNSLIAFLSYFQLANIDFEILQNFKSALINYENCIENFPSHFLSEEKKSLIHTRIDLLTQNSQDNWQPLNLYLQAKNADKSSVSKILYQKIVTDYPNTPLAKESVKILTQMACKEQPDDINLSEELVSFYQNLIDNSKDNKQLSDVMQLGIGDIFNYSLRNHSQAVIEYSKLVGNNPNSEQADIAQQRIRELNNRP